MGSIGVYIFRTTFGAFLLVLVSLTSLIWITQALREVDLMTNRGQTVFVFVGITSLIIPNLVLIIAPLALVVAIAHTLNKLSSDSEIIVMNAAGMPPWRLFRPFLAVSIIGSIAIAMISAYFAPDCLRMLRRWLTEVRTDLITNIVQPGRFTTVDRGLTFFIRERQPNGLLVGILLDDRRDEKARVTILADRGEIVKNEAGNFILFESGNIQQQDAKQPDPSIVQFDRYAFDLSQFASGSQVVNYSVRERYLWELLWPNPNDPQYKLQPGHFRAELHERFLGTDLSFGIPRAGLRISRRAKHHAPEPHLVDRRAHGQRGGAAADGIRGVNRRRVGPAIHRLSVLLDRGCRRFGSLRHFSRNGHRASGRLAQSRQHAD